MSRTVVRPRSALGAKLLLIGMLVWPLSPVAQADSTSTTTFSGRATVVKATAPVVGTVVLSDTGDLPSSGGTQEASFLTESVPGLLAVDTLHATTIGQGNSSQSEASVADLTLTTGGHTVNAEFLMSHATAVCGSGGPSASGGSEIASLSVDKQTVAVSGQPNQTVTLPDQTGQIIINEQKSKRSGDITVNALHVTLNTPAGPTDVVIASAHADISCPPPGQVNCSVGSDFVTGGGWITTPSGAKGTFAVAGGIKQGQFWGHLEYFDHGSGEKAKGLAVTGYAVTGPTMREIKGTADINGAPVTYQVDVADNGEPGRGVDTFSVFFSDGYSAGGTLAGGNIQLHKPC